jgi:hypothetical protein
MKTTKSMKIKISKAEDDKIQELVEKYGKK